MGGETDVGGGYNEDTLSSLAYLFQNCFDVIVYPLSSPNPDILYFLLDFVSHFPHFTLKFSEFLSPRLLLALAWSNRFGSQLPSMDSSTVLRSFQLGTVAHEWSLLERPGMVTSRKLHVECLSNSRKLLSSTTKRKGMIVSCLKTPDTTKSVNSTENDPQVALEKNIRQSATFPSGFEDLVLEVCDETEVAELKLKIGDFEMHMKRKIGATKAPESFVSPTIAPPPVPSEPMIESIPEVTPPSPPKPSSASMNPFKDNPEKKSPKLIALEASGETGYVFVTSTVVGSFQKGRKVKGRKLPPVCKEGDVIKEGQVIGYVDQFGTVFPLRSDKDGEIIKYLLDEEDAVGYGDPVLALLPSFHSIN